MRKLLELIEKLYGKTALSKTLGTRTNVITLSDNETKRFIKDELNIEAASDAAALAAKNRAEKLIADIPKMNDQEILTFTNNLQRLDNKLNPPKAEMFDITTKKPISKEGIEQLETDFGLPEGVDEGSIMGNLTRAAQRLREQSKNVPGIQQGEKLQTGVMRSAVRYKMLDDLEKGILKVSEEEAAIIKGEAKGDPLDLWLENYGPDAMEAIQEMEPALRRGTTPKDLLLTIEKNVDARPLTEAEKLEMKANTREAGRVMQEYKDRVKGLSKEELKQKDPEMYDLLYGEGDPEEFAKGGRVGYEDGGPTKDEYGIMSLPSVPSNPNSVNDDIDRVAQLVAQSYKMGPEEQMNNKQIAYDRIEEIAEQISYGGNIDGVRSNLIDYFNDKVQEYENMIQEFSTGGRVGFAGGMIPKALQTLFKTAAQVSDAMRNVKNSVFDNWNNVRMFGEQEGIAKNLEGYTNIPSQNRKKSALENIENLKKVLPEKYHKDIDVLKNATDQNNFKTAWDKFEEFDKNLDPTLKFENIPEEYFPMLDPLNDAFVVTGPKESFKQGRYQIKTAMDIDPKTGKPTGKYQTEKYDTFDPETRTFKDEPELVGVDTDKGKEGLN